MRIVVIDNFDSFVYNLVHYIEEITQKRPTIFRNNEFKINELENYDVIVLSPGPGLPKEAGLLMQVIEKYHKSKIIIGVCLGHQAIGEYFGGKLKNLENVYHGVTSKLQKINDSVLYKNINDVTVGRYHSWVVQSNTLPNFIKITSEDTNGEIMSFKHNELPIYGMQFHPESVLTPQGKDMLANLFTHFTKWFYHEFNG